MAVPFTGAFSFVVCPRCHTQVRVSTAARVPDEAAPPFPSAAATDRVAGGAGKPSDEYELPTADEIHLIGPPLPSGEALLLRGARFATAGAAALVLFVLVNNLVLLVGSAPAAVGAAAGADHEVVSIFLITPTPVSVASLGGAAAATWHVGLVAVIVASCALLLRQHARGAFHHFGGALLGPGSPRLDEPNGIFLMARLFCVSLFFTEAVVIGVEIAGGTTSVPDWIAEAPVGELLVSLAHASVWEEVVGRSLLLGLPLLAVHWAGRGALDRPAWSYLTGGKLAMDAPAVAFLIFSATAFGLAHIVGWELWKLPTSMVAGLVFGVLFLRLGIHAAIVAHFLHDYLPAAGLLGATEGYLLLLSVVVLALALVGAANFIRYLFVVREVLEYGGVPPHLGGPTPAPAGAAGARWAARRAESDEPAPEGEAPLQRPPPGG